MEIPATGVSRSGKRTTRATIDVVGRLKPSAAARVRSNLSYCYEAGIFEDSMLLSDHPPVSQKTGSFRERHYSIFCPETHSMADLFFLEDRPLLTVPRSTGNHPEKGQSACPGLSLVSSFWMRRAVLERSCECLANKVAFHICKPRKAARHNFSQGLNHDSRPDCLC
jgi:hypothetical protein